MILQALYNSGLNRQVDKATVVFGHGMNVIGGNGWCARPKLSLCALTDGARGNQRRETMDTASGSWLERRSMIDTRLYLPTGHRQHLSCSMWLIIQSCRTTS
jgi:hypothetical protein